MIFSESERTIRKRFQPSGNQRILPGRLSPSIGSATLSEADRLFSFADLHIGKRILCVLGALSETGGSNYSFGKPTSGLKDISPIG
jgi:hypothetical protein